MRGTLSYKYTNVHVCLMHLKLVHIFIFNYMWLFSIAALHHSRRRLTTHRPTDLLEESLTLFGVRWL